MLGLIGLVAAAQLSAPACPIDRAVYRLHGAPAFTAGFARQDKRKAFASDLAFWLKTPKRTFWFSFGASNGYGGTWIATDTDPDRSAASPEPLEIQDPPDGEAPVLIDFDAFASDLAPLRAPPRAGDPPPALLFARGLGAALWYDWVSLAGGDETAVQEQMPAPLFEAAECREEAG